MHKTPAIAVWGGLHPAMAGGSCIGLPFFELNGVLKKERSPSVSQATNVSHHNITSAISNSPNNKVTTHKEDTITK